MRNKSEILKRILIDVIGSKSDSEKGYTLTEIRLLVNERLFSIDYFEYDFDVSTYPHPERLGFNDGTISARIRDLLTGIYRKEREKNTGRAKVIRYWILPEKRLAA